MSNSIASTRPSTHSLPSSSATRNTHLDALWDYSQPVESALRFANAAEEAARAGDLNCELEALTQQARGLGLAGELEWAHSILDSVDRRLHLVSGCRPAVRAKLERGRALNGAKLTFAQSQFLEAWELARQGGEDGLAVDAARMVAITNAAEPDVALAWNLCALEFAECSQDEEARRWLGSLYDTIGWAHFDKGEYPRALAVFSRAVAFREAQGSGMPLLNAKWCVGRTLRALTRTAEALAAQQRLLGEHEALGLAATGLVYEELGENTLSLGAPGHEAFFRRAYSLLSEDTAFTRQYSERLARLRDLGRW